MKNLFLAGILAACITAVWAVVFAGEIRTLPQSVVLTNPTTDKAELVDLTFHFGANPYATVRYHIIDSAGNVRGNHAAYIRNEVDDPETPEDETTDDFTAFIATIGTTLYDRMLVKVWTDIQNNYEIQ